jgi:hypothetical protein
MSLSTMSDLVQRARDFATQAHQRIDQRRKHSGQPYDVHLKAVADLVASTGDDAEAVAAAWLHDVVEDTPATFDELRDRFGPGVARLVAEVTDVSRPTDGNRSRRKALDREHLAGASPRGQTIKLADLIDNARDITRHDPRFAPVFLGEMAQLLEVLGVGEPRLRRKAELTLAECAARLGVTLPSGQGRADAKDGAGPGSGAQIHALRTFARVFAARDIAEPLRSFDADWPPEQMCERMRGLGLFVAGLRSDGAVTGYVRLPELECDPEGSRRQLGADQVVGEDASLSDVIWVLTRHEHCFVTALDSVVGVITRADIQKPVVRMWLFGMVTLVEAELTRRVREAFGGERWTALVTPSRLERARQLQAERARREQACDLLDCLQLGDKAAILLSDPRVLAEFGFTSRKAARKVVKELESLRNNLAHAQDIVTHDWPQIARMTRNLQADALED